MKTTKPVPKKMIYNLVVNSQSDIQNLQETGNFSNTGVFANEKKKLY